MVEDRAKSGTFREIAAELLGSGFEFRFCAVGRSMLPTIQDGEIVRVRPVETGRLRVGDIVLFRDRDGFKAHRVVGRRGGLFVTRGDSSRDVDGVIREAEILGKITSKECRQTGKCVRLEGLRARVRFYVAQAKTQLVRLQGCAD